MEKSREDGLMAKPTCTQVPLRRVCSRMREVTFVLYAT